MIRITTDVVKFKGGKEVDLIKAYQAYKASGSLERAAEKLPISKNTLNKAFRDHGYVLKNRKWSTDNDKALIRYYKQTPEDRFSLDALAYAMGRTKQMICRQAKRLKLTDKHRPMNLESIEKNREKSRALITERETDFLIQGSKKYLKKNGHPKGMKGKSHSAETKAAISRAGIGRKVPPEQVDKMLKTKIERYGSAGAPPQNRKGCSWKAGWRTIGGKKNYYRSRWEANYGRYLEFLKQSRHIKDWQHEPDTFWFENIKRGCRSYLPDFKVWTIKGIYYVEVKGWMDDRSKTKLKRMKKYHPKIDLKLIESKAYKKLCRQLSPIIKGWE